MAHKKAAGSAKNLRDSKPKYRGIKIYGGQKVTAGSIILRQKGDKRKSGANTYKGRDFSVHAAIDGIVNFRQKRVKRYDGRIYARTFVEVLPETATPAAKGTKATKAAPKAKAAATTKTATKKPAVKKTTTKKATPKVAATKKPAAKKTTTKKSAAKKAA